MAVEQTSSRVSISSYGTGENRAESGYSGNGRDHASQGLAKALGWFSIGLGVAEALLPGRLMDLIGTPRHSSTNAARGAGKSSGRSKNAKSQPKKPGAHDSRIFRGT
jgi:hypothetical protein